MRIQKLTLGSFRSYDRLSFECTDSDLHVLVGPNGSGKTNIVEAISLLSLGRSCLKATCDEMLRDGSEFFRVRADMRTDGGEDSSVECVFQLVPRRATAFSIRDVRTPLLRVIGALPTMIFLPQHLDLFSGAPAGRRGFLDALLSQLVPEYASARMQYDRVLKQRNTLLRSIAAGEAAESDLDPWDAELSPLGMTLRSHRMTALKAFNDALPKELSALGEHFDSLSVEPGFESIDLLSALHGARKKDIVIGTTSIGPHRDDWTVVAERHPIGPYLSRGQQRTVILSLLFISASMFEEKRGERPVILLDDVLSELDQRHQEALLSRLVDHQVIITTTHDAPQVTGLRTWRVGGGGVIAA